jgi:hypothetical protein
MNLIAEHGVDEDGKPVVFVDGLRVWLRKSQDHWVANGIDIDYATAGESPEIATRAFMTGLCLTIVEHMKRFNSIEKLLARRAPDEIYQAWIREVERNNLHTREMILTLPMAEFSEEAPRHVLPHSVSFYAPQQPPALQLATAL